MSDEEQELFAARKNPKTGDIDVTYKGYSNIQFITVHRAKGLEADEVIVLNLVNDRRGFPNQIVDDPILNLLLADSDDHQFAEERRLFYVAITRTKNRVFLVASHGEAYRGRSIFVDELLDGNDDGRVRLITEDGERAPVHCPRCGKGILIVRRNSKDGREFLGCTNFPFCEKTYPSTEILEHQVKCPGCGGWMVKRSGSQGDFYGCTNYHDGICAATINITGSDTVTRSSTAVGYQAGAPRSFSQSSGTSAVRTTKGGRSAGGPCPRPGCGGSMVKCSGPHGDFFGCTNFPDCTATTSLDSSGRAPRAAAAISSQARPAGRTTHQGSRSSGQTAHKRQPIGRLSCPICGAPMVAKTGKYGKFYSCSKWPACKGKKNLG